MAQFKAQFSKADTIRARREEHDLVDLVLICGDAVHYELLAETCPFKIMAGKTIKWQQKIHVDIAKREQTNRRGGGLSPPPHSHSRLCH